MKKEVTISDLDMAVRVHPLGEFKELGSAWADLLLTACPQTGTNGEIRKVGDFYPPSGTPIFRPTLYNFERLDPTLDVVQAYLTAQGMVSLGARKMYTIVQFEPDLLELLARSCLGLVSLERCSYLNHAKVAVAQLSNVGRTARLKKAAGKWDGYFWYPAVPE